MPPALKAALDRLAKLIKRKPVQQVLEENNKTVTILPFTASPCMLHPELET